MEILQSHLGEIDNLKSQIPKANFPIPAFPHEYYHKYFNLVDLHDRYFYHEVSSHYNRNWKKKFLLGLLDSATINVWVLSSISSFSPFIIFIPHLLQI